MVTMTAHFSTSPVSLETSRRERLENLKQYFLHVLVEDSQDGTPFDCDVLAMIEHLKEIYYGGNKIQTSIPNLATRIAKEQRINEILTTSREKTITKEEYDELRALLRKKYHYGDSMPEYHCPKCDHSLVLWWTTGGPICPYSGGCGWRLDVK